MQNTYNSNGTTKLCTVMAVDVVRKVCKCTSDTGEILSEVRWVVPMGGTDGTGLSVHPLEGSRVLVDTSSGFPFIIGSIPIDSAGDVKRTNINRQDVSEPDTADYSSVSMGVIIRGPGTPKDQRVGDNLFTADGGGLMGLLASGTAIIKSSPMAQIISSRFGDLVRIVSRNFEHFTEVDSNIKASIRGKTFTIRDLFKSPDRSRTVISRDGEGKVTSTHAPRPSKVTYEGDVMWGETVGREYASFTADTFPTAPIHAEDAALIYKSYTFKYEPDLYNTRIDTVDDSGLEYTKVIQDDNVFERTLSNAGYSASFSSASSNSVSTDNAGELKKEVTTGDKTSWWMNESAFHWDCGGVVKIDGDLNRIVLDVDGKVVITANADGTLLITTTAKATMDFGAGLDINVTGETNLVSSGNINMQAPEIHLN